MQKVSYIRGAVCVTTGQNCETGGLKHCHLNILHLPICTLTCMYETRYSIRIILFNILVRTYGTADFASRQRNKTRCAG